MTQEEGWALWRTGELCPVRNCSAELLLSSSQSFLQVTEKLLSVPNRRVSWNAPGLYCALTRQGYRWASVTIWLAQFSIKRLLC